MQQNQQRQQNATFPMGQQNANPQMFGNPGMFMNMNQQQQQMMMQQAAMQQQQFAAGGGNQMMQPGMGGQQQQPMMPQNFLPIGMQQQLSNNSGMPKAAPVHFENNKTLYIGNLGENTFDGEIYKFFQNNGHPVANCRVIIDTATKKSKRFGYLNFKSEEEAVSCLEAMNNKELGGRSIILNKKKESDFDSQANLLVKNIPDSTTQEKLNELFSPFGQIISCKVEMDQSNKSRGFGYVQFQKAADATTALGKMNGTKIGDKDITVTNFAKRNEREDVQDLFRNLYVSNLPTTLSQPEFQAVFAPYGEISKFKYDADKGVGFVMYATHEQAKKAIEELNQKKEINGQYIFVQKHISQAANQFGKKSQITQQMKQNFESNICVQFVPKGVTDEEFKTEMEKVGKIISVKLREFTQQNKATGQKFSNFMIGYVNYEDVKVAQKCIQKYHQSQPFGMGKKPLSVDFWQSRDDMTQQRDEKSNQKVMSMIHMIQNEMNRNSQFQGGYQQNQRFNGGRGGGRGGDRGGRGGYRGGRGGRGGYHQNKPHQNQRPMTTNHQINLGANQPSQGANPSGQVMLQLPHCDLNQLDQLEGEAKTQFVGNCIFGVITQGYGQEHAPRLTGMLLDEKAVNFKQLLTDAAYFNNKVQEAFALLAQSSQQQPAQQQQQQQQTPVQNQQ